jgi:hypothetical protein
VSEEESPFLAKSLDCNRQVRIKTVCLDGRTTLGGGTSVVAADTFVATLQPAGELCFSKDHRATTHDATLDRANSLPKSNFNVDPLKRSCQVAGSKFRLDFTLPSNVDELASDLYLYANVLSDDHWQRLHTMSGRETPLTIHAVGNIGGILSLG